MATLYTYPIANGEDITFEKFAISCLPNFGIYTRFDESQRKALVERYELPEKFEPDKSRLKDYERVKKEYEDKLKNPKTDEELEKEYNEYAQKVVKGNDDRLKRSKILRERYGNMLKKVESWIPPTEQYEGIKSFMRQQLLDSIEYDCDNFYYEKLIPKDEWIKEKKDNSYLIESMNRQMEMYKKSVKEADKGSQFIKEFKESIKKVK